PVGIALRHEALRVRVMSYQIVRFRRTSNGRPRIIRRGLTLEEAQEHCGRPETSGKKLTCGKCDRRFSQETHSGRSLCCRAFMVSDWFDGYQEAH
ncbi:MAG: hypothetical protein ACYS8L_09385, partial [Planctomycetota bacterium]